MGVKSGSRVPDPVIALLSADESLAQAAGSVIEAPWRLERRFYIGGLLDFQLPHVRLVLVDDDAVADGDRGWLLAQIRRHLDKATLLYVAACHSAENERRSNGAHYYTSKPVQADELAGVLRAFIKLASRDSSL